MSGTTIEAYITHSASLKQRQARRRLSVATSDLGRPQHADLFEFSAGSLGPILVSLKQQLLSYLTELEERLSSLESPISTESLKGKGKATAEEVRAWAETGREMLEHIRTEVCSHLPDFYQPDVSLDIAKLPTLDDQRVQDAVSSPMRPNPPEKTASDAFLCSKPLQYIYGLSEHLQSLESHLQSAGIPYLLEEFASLVPNIAAVRERLDGALSSGVLRTVSVDIKEGEEALELAVHEVTRALKRSLNGARLIQYTELPQLWQNNRFVGRGYRFIPLAQWPRLLMSMFTIHNETLNIHTHFVPFLVWSLTLLPFSPLYSAAVAQFELPDVVFTACALLCLFSSTLWHTMAGCSHLQSMNLCACVDYVGIGWLICSTLGTVVYYGFREHETAKNFWLSVSTIISVISGLAPFLTWFNEVRHRKYRIMFYLSIGFSSLAPIGHLAYLYGAADTLAFLGPVFKSVLAYVAGLLFYASHFPEGFLTSPGDAHWLDWLGGGSHAIWHLFVVAAIILHRHAMQVMKAGIQ